MVNHVEITPALFSLIIAEIPTQELHEGNDGQWPDIPAVPAGAWISPQLRQEIRNEPNRKLHSSVSKMHTRSDNQILEEIDVLNTQWLKLWLKLNHISQYT